MKSHAIAAASVTLLLSATATQAAQVAALIGDNTIAVVDTAARKVVQTWPLSGLSGRVAGIDVRPADGLLYALAADGSLYTVDMSNGRATMKVRLEMMLPANVSAAVDFNPVADRLRVIGSDGTSLRVNVDDGKVTKDGSLKFAAADPNMSKAPRAVAAAYTNSVKGAKETTLYDIDAATGALVRQAPPNDGVLNTVGVLGLPGEMFAFDIWADGQGKNDAWLMTPSGLHSVDLTTGKAGPAMKIDGVNQPVRDIAILPAM